LALRESNIVWAEEEAGDEADAVVAEVGVNVDADDDVDVDDDVDDDVDVDVNATVPSGVTEEVAVADGDGDDDVADADVDTDAVVPDDVATRSINAVTSAARNQMWQHTQRVSASATTTITTRTIRYNVMCDHYHHYVSVLRPQLLAAPIVMTRTVE
jgi:hypothetical protein